MCWHTKLLRRNRHSPTLEDPHDDHTNHVKNVTVVLKIPMPLLLSARMPGYHLKSVKKWSNTWETLMNIGYRNAKWDVEELIHIHIYLTTKGIKSLTTFRTIYRTVKMVSYDVTELITSKHIRTTKRSLSVVAICVNTRQNTAESEKNMQIASQIWKKG
jgi:hypothetical protein